MKIFLPAKWYNHLILLIGLIVAWNLEGDEVLGVQRAYCQIIFLIISVALSVAASLLLQQGIKNPIDDDKPTVLTTRGSFLTWVMGRRLVGPVFAAAANRRSEKESVGGKGFGNTSKQKIFQEDGWHQLTMGEHVVALHSIRQSGKIIFSGPITPQSHPSGSAISLGSQGAFFIYWGEENQPPETYMPATGMVPITSRWPLCCYVLWVRKRLGPQPIWPPLLYEIETRPLNTRLTQSQAYFPPTLTLDGGIVAIDAIDLIDGKLIFIDEAVAGALPATSTVRLTGNSGVPDQDLVVLRSEVVIVEVMPFIFTKQTEVTIVDGLPLGITATGQIQKYTVAPDDGLNAAHCIAEMLFHQWPQGLNIDPDGPEPWDMNALEALGVLLETEELKSSWVATGGEQAAAILSAAMQDMGFMVPIDTSKGGRLSFKPVRDPSGTTVLNIPSDAYAQKQPELDTHQDALPQDRMVFTYADREHSYGDMTLAVDDDGQASAMEIQNAKKAPIRSVVNFGTAAKIVERRSQEGLAGGGKFPLVAGREARELLPGDVVTADAVFETLRVIEVKTQPGTTKTTVLCAPDYFGARLSDFDNQGQSGGQVQSLDPAPDPQFIFVEIPEHLLLGDPMSVIVPRIRSHQQITEALIHFSRDNSTYTFVTSQDTTETGGTLDEALSATSQTVIENGPVINELGPDIATALDLTADVTNWRLGRQICVIHSAAGTEICFLRNLEALGGSQSRLRGLIRGRYDTRRLAHPIGAQVFIFELPDTVYQDVLLVPDADFYVKTQPSTSSGQLSLSEIVPFGNVLQGKGVVPMAPEGLKVTAPAKMVPGYATGNNVTFEWTYLSTESPKTGAGMQGAGAATGVSAYDGQFIFKITTTGDVEVFATTLTGTSITVDPDTLLGVHSDFKAKLVSTRGSFTSDERVLTVEAI